MHTYTPVRINTYQHARTHVHTCARAYVVACINTLAMLHPWNWMRLDKKKEMRKVSWRFVLLRPLSMRARGPSLPPPRLSLPRQGEEGTPPPASLPSPGREGRGLPPPAGYSGTPPPYCSRGIHLPIKFYLTCVLQPCILHTLPPVSHVSLYPFISSSTCLSYLCSI